MEEEKSAQERAREQAQEAYGGNIKPEFNIDLFIEAKADTDGKPSFTYYDKEKSERKFSYNPLEGYLLGVGNELSAFSSELGSRGGTYESSPYWSNDLITLWEPSRSGSKKVVVGTIDEVESWLVVNGVGDRVRKRKLLFILSGEMVIQIKTNMSLSINDSNKFQPTTFLYNKIVLTPTMYDPDDPDISSKSKKYLGDFAKRNKPTYAKMTTGGTISSSEFDEHKIGDWINKFLEWKKYLLSFAPMKTQEPVQQESISEPQQDFQLPVTKEETKSEENEQSDLPF